MTAAGSASPNCWSACRFRWCRSRSCASRRHLSYIQSLAYRGLTLTAEDALHHGLVDTATAPDRLLDEAVAAAESLAALPAPAFTLTKAQLREPSLQRMRAGAAIDAAVQEVWASDATLAAIRDYIARTFKKPSP